MAEVLALVASGKQQSNTQELLKTWTDRGNRKIFNLFDNHAFLEWKWKPLGLVFDKTLLLLYTTDTFWGVFSLDFWSARIKISFSAGKLVFMPRAAQLYQIYRQKTEIWNIYNCVRTRGQDSLNEGDTYLQWCGHLSGVCYKPVTSAKVSR